MGVIKVRVRYGFFFQAEDGIRDLVRSRGLGDVYKRQVFFQTGKRISEQQPHRAEPPEFASRILLFVLDPPCLLYTSDAADERSSVDLGGRRIIKKKTHTYLGRRSRRYHKQYITRQARNEYLNHIQKKK